MSQTDLAENQTWKKQMQTDEFHVDISSVKKNNNKISISWLAKKYLTHSLT